MLSTSNSGAKVVEELLDLGLVPGANPHTGPEADVCVSDELHPDHLGGEAAKRNALRGSQQQLELDPGRVEQRPTEDRGVERDDL